MNAPRIFFCDSRRDGNFIRNIFLYSHATVLGLFLHVTTKHEQCPGSFLSPISTSIYVQFEFRLENCLSTQSTVFQIVPINLSSRACERSIVKIIICVALKQFNSDPGSQSRDSSTIHHHSKLLNYKRSFTCGHSRVPISFQQTSRRRISRISKFENGYPTG